MALRPASPLARPTTVAPSSKRWAPAANDSCSSLPRAGRRSVRLLRAAHPVRQQHRHHDGGDSISAIAAARWPPKGLPRCSGIGIAVTKVTAPTEP